MDRRSFLSVVAVAFAGCTTSAQEDFASTTESDSSNKYDTLNPQYLGVHDDHTGPTIESVEHIIHGACKSAIYVDLSEPPQDATIKAWFYKDESPINVVKQATRNDLGVEQRLAFEYCTMDKYDAFEVAII